MKKILFILISGGIIACNGGGGSGSDTPNPNPTPTATISPNSVTPYPYPPAESYPVMPDGFAAAIPSFMDTVVSSSNSLQIAYGYNTNPAAPSLVAYINQSVAGEGTYICSATPVLGDGNGGTWLVGAAHCFLSSKSNSSVVSSSDILSMNNLRVLKGIYGSTIISFSAQVFIPKNYCQGATFSGLGECPNFGPGDGAINGQGNDIALIHITSKFNSNESYPRLAQESEYPAAYTMAPVLSLGFGENNIDNGIGAMFYVVNYYYQQYNPNGYHYLFNSYYNPYAGYSALICGGDSGGPDLYWNGSQWLLLSEHTYGPAGACGEFYTTLPNGATNVSFYYDWLMGIINSGPSGATVYCNASANCVTNGV